MPTRSATAAETMRRQRAREGAATRAPKPGTRRRSSEIIDAAVRVFAARGYHGTTTTDIADELGIRQASLYYYFASKEAALEAVIARGVEGHEQAALAILASEGTPARKLARLIEAHLRPVIERGDYVRVFHNERHHLPPASRRRIRRVARAVESVFETVIRQGVASGEFRPDTDPRLATLAILGMANAVASWYEREAAPMEDICRHWTRLALAGLGADAAAVL